MWLRDKRLNMGSGEHGVKNAQLLLIKNLKTLRKRPRAPKYVWQLAWLIKEMAEEEGDHGRFGLFEFTIRDTRLNCDDPRRADFKDEEKAHGAK